MEVQKTEQSIVKYNWNRYITYNKDSNVLQMKINFNQMAKSY